MGLERASWDLWAVSSSNQDFSSSIHLRSSITNWALPAVGRPADHRLSWLQHCLKLPTDDNTESRNGLSFLTAMVSLMSSSSWKLDANFYICRPVWKAETLATWQTKQETGQNRTASNLMNVGCIMEKNSLKISPITLTSKGCINIWKLNCFCVAGRLFTLSTFQISAQLSKHSTIPGYYSVCRSDSGSCIGLFFFSNSHYPAPANPWWLHVKFHHKRKDSVIISPTSCFYLAKIILPRSIFVGFSKTTFSPWSKLFPVPAVSHKGRHAAMI